MSNQTHITSKLSVTTTLARKQVNACPRKSRFAFLRQDMILRGCCSPWDGPWQPCPTAQRDHQIPGRDVFPFDDSQTPALFCPDKGKGVECLPPTTLTSFLWASGQLVHTGILGKVMWRCSHCDGVVQGRIGETSRVHKGMELGINCVSLSIFARKICFKAPS